MNFNMVTLGNGMMTVSGDKNSTAGLKAQMMNQTGAKMPAPHFMMTRPSNFKHMVNA